METGMALEKIQLMPEQAAAGVTEIVAQPETCTRLGIVITVYVIAFLLAQAPSSRAQRKLLQQAT